MSNTGTILHVEDSDADVFLLQYAFKRVAITNPVQVVTDGQQAIDYLFGAGRFADRELYPIPLLVLLDLQLPYKTGLEVLEWVQGEPSLKWLIVIILSSSIYKDDVQRAYMLGANAFLVKPSNPDVLASMCQSLKDFWLDYNHPPVESLVNV